MAYQRRFFDEARDRLRDLMLDLISFSAILISIWAIDQLHHTLWDGEGLIFFEGTSFPIRGKWIIDAADAGNLICFSIRTLWLFGRGVFHR